MSVWYLDTSAALKLLVEEEESDALAHVLDTERATLAACFLVETELRRAVHRIDALTHEAVSQVLTSVDLYDVPASMFREAGHLPGAQLRSLDAIHLACALRIGADAIVTYDRRLADAAATLGITAAAPGIPSRA